MAENNGYFLTLPAFEEASQKVKEVTVPTELIYSDYFSNQSGNKVYLCHRLCRKPCTGRCTGCTAVWMQSHHRHANDDSSD